MMIGYLQVTLNFVLYKESKYLHKVIDNTVLHKFSFNMCSKPDKIIKELFKTVCHNIHHRPIDFKIILLFRLYDFIHFLLTDRSLFFHE